MKTAIVIFHTQYGNTEKIAKALVLGMREQGVDVDCATIDTVEVDHLAAYDLVAIGGPTHFRTASKPMKAFLAKLGRGTLNGKNAFVFDTKAQSWWAGSAGKAIETRLKRIGMRIIKPRASAIILAREGPLQDGAESTFRQIGTDLARLL